MATVLLNNQYWAYGQAPDIRFTFSYDSRRSGANMQYKFYWVFHSLNTPQSGFGWPIYGTVSLDGRTKLNGIQIKGVQPMQWFDSNTVKYTSDWVTVDGKLSGTTAWSMTLFSGSGMTRSQTWSGTLAVLPAQSSFTVSAAEIGSEVTVSIGKAQSAYRHTVQIKLSDTYVQNASDVDESYSYSIPMAWCNGITDAAVGTMTVTVTTFNGELQIGDPVVQTVPLAVPSSVVPALSVSVSAVDGFGAYYLTGISKARFRSTATMAYSAEVDSIVISFDSQAGSGADWTSGTFASAGAYTWRATVTDSRGRKATQTGTVTFTAYTVPTISGQQPYRCLSNKTASESGTYVLCKATVAYTALTGNSITITTAYKAVSDSYFTTADTVSGASIDIAGCSGHILLTSAYDIKITATDTVGNSAEFVGTVLSSANYYFTALNGKFAIGRYLDKTKSDGLQVEGDLHLTGEVKGNAQTATALDAGYGDASHPVYIGADGIPVPVPLSAGVKATNGNAESFSANQEKTFSGEKDALLVLVANSSWGALQIWDPTESGTDKSAGNLATKVTWGANEVKIKRDGSSSGTYNYIIIWEG